MAVALTNSRTKSLSRQERPTPAGGRLSSGVMVESASGGGADADVARSNRRHPTAPQRKERALTQEALKVTTTKTIPRRASEEGKSPGSGRDVPSKALPRRASEERAGAGSRPGRTSWRAPVQSKRNSLTQSETGSDRPRRRTDGGEGASVLVVARIRPCLKHEPSDRNGVQVLDDNQTLILSDGTQHKQFAVDRAFDSRQPENTQEYFFKEVGGKLVQQSLEGYNVCIFAYGHTGSGKTYTMVGDGVKMDINITGPGAGFMPRFIDAIFEEHMSTDNMSVSYLSEFYEVYNEQIRDLLVGDINEKRTKTVRVHPKLGMMIEGLTQSVVSTAKETLDLLHYGNQLRTVSTTTMNERSSRSHAIFTFRFEQVQGGDGGTGCEDRRESIVTFVDLAGREDQNASMNKEGLFREMTYINTSLFHLGHLITKLAEGKMCGTSMAEFRNSKLTLVLAQALGGNSRTALVATLAPPQSYYADTVSTLNFAQTVKKIQTKPVVNNKSRRDAVQELQAEVKRLQAQLQEARDVHQQDDQDKDEELKAAQALVNFYKQSWEERKVISQKQADSRRKMSVFLGLTTLDIQAGIAGALPPPFLTKLSDDPALQGCCNYFLQKRHLRIGSNPDADIPIQGVGIQANMCEVSWFNGEVRIDLLWPDSDSESGLDDSSSTTSSPELQRVLINGQQLTDETLLLKHGDSILLGYSHVFRLVVPTQEMVEKARNRTDATTLARLSIANLDASSAINQTPETDLSGMQGFDGGPQYKELHPFIKQLKLRVAPNTMDKLLKSLIVTCPLVDEANQITKAVLGRSELKFQLQVLMNLFDVDVDSPEIVVCVLRKTGSKSLSKNNSVSSTTNVPSTADRRASLVPSFLSTMVNSVGLGEQFLKGSNRDNVLYVWPLEKFLQRLDVMREAYQEGDDCDFVEVRKRLQAKPYLNPWREMSFTDVKEELEFADQPGGRSALKLLGDIKEEGDQKRAKASKPPKAVKRASVKKAAAGSQASTTDLRPQLHSEGDLAPAQEMVQELDGCLFNGLIASASDLHVETMTIEVAKLKCHAIPGCKGFTFRGPPTKEPVQIHFKGEWVVRGNPTGERWTSYKAEDASTTKVVTAITFQSLSYDRLASDYALKQKLENTIRKTIAAEVGNRVTELDVDVVLPAGARKVQITVSVPPGVALRDIAETLDQGSVPGSRFEEAIVRAVQMVPEIDSIKDRGAAITASIEPPSVALAAQHRQVAKPVPPLPPRAPGAPSSPRFTMAAPMPTASSSSSCAAPAGFDRASKDAKEFKGASRSDSFVEDSVRPVVAAAAIAGSTGGTLGAGGTPIHEDGSCKAGGDDASLRTSREALSDAPSPTMCESATQTVHPTSGLNFMLCNGAASSRGASPYVRHREGVWSRPVSPVRRSEGHWARSHSPTRCAVPQQGTVFPVFAGPQVSCGGWAATIDPAVAAALRANASPHPVARRMIHPRTASAAASPMVPCPRTVFVSDSSSSTVSCFFGAAPQRHCSPTVRSVSPVMPVRARASPQTRSTSTAPMSCSQPPVTIGIAGPLMTTASPVPTVATVGTAPMVATVSNVPVVTSISTVPVVSTTAAAAGIDVVPRSPRGGAPRFHLLEGYDVSAPMSPEIVQRTNEVTMIDASDSVGIAPSPTTMVLRQQGPALQQQLAIQQHQQPQQPSQPPQSQQHQASVVSASPRQKSPLRYRPVPGRSVAFTSIAHAAPSRHAARPPNTRETWPQAKTSPRVNSRASPQISATQSIALSGARTPPQSPRPQRPPAEISV